MPGTGMQPPGGQQMMAPPGANIPQNFGPPTPAGAIPGAPLMPGQAPRPGQGMAPPAPAGGNSQRIDPAQIPRQGVNREQALDRL